MKVTSLNDLLAGCLTQFDKLDLGEKYDDRYGCCGPAKPEKKIWYPTVYMNGKGQDYSTIPANGKATIEYKVMSRTTSEDEDGKKRHNITLELHTFDPIDGTKDKSKAKGDGIASEVDVGGKKDSAAKQLATEMGAMMGELMTRFGVEQVQRERSDAGTFVANETGGADPLTMKQAYGPKKKTVLAATAGAAAVGAGAMGLRAVKKNWGGPGVPLKDSLKAAGSHYGKQAKKALSRWRTV